MLVSPGGAKFSLSWLISRVRRWEPGDTCSAEGVGRDEWWLECGQPGQLGQLHGPGRLDTHSLGTEGSCLSPAGRDQWYQEFTPGWPPCPQVSAQPQRNSTVSNDQRV